MELRKPDTPITAVAKGAVICGIEKNNTTNLIRATCCKHSYGIRVGEEFSDLRNDQRDAKEDEITGRILADQQMRWLINKGDAVLSTKPLEVEQEVVVRFDKEDDRSPRKGKLRIWRWSEDKDRPTRYHIRRNGTLPSFLVTRGANMTSTGIWGVYLGIRSERPALEGVRPGKKSFGRQVSLFCFVDTEALIGVEQIECTTHLER